MKMKTMLVGIVGALALVAMSAQARLIAVVEDLNNPGTEDIFTDLDYGILGATVLGTQGSLVFGDFNSGVLATYWTGTLHTALSDYADPTQTATLVSTAGALQAVQTGENVLVNILADGYQNPAGSPVGFETTVNASTLIDATYDFLVDIEPGSIPLLVGLNIADTSTYTENAVIDISAPFGISHTLRIDALALGLIGMTVARKMRNAKSTETI